MNGDEWITVPNWDKFQHYGNRRPVWIKLYTELQHKNEWLELSYAARGLLVTIWLEYSARQRPLRRKDLPRNLRDRVNKKTLDSLVQAGFIEVSASKLLAQRELLRSSQERAPAHARGAAHAQEKKTPVPRPPLPDVVFEFMRTHGIRNGQP